jgi:hypothetical protein
VAFGVHSGFVAFDTFHILWIVLARLPWYYTRYMRWLLRLSCVKHRFKVQCRLQRGTWMLQESFGEMLGGMGMVLMC